jgi:hypothetical protein
LSENVLHLLDFPGKLQTPVQEVEFMAADAEQLSGVGHGLMVVKILAGKNIQTQV